MTRKKFTIFGRKYRMGSYILLIRVSKAIELVFGRFQQGRHFTIPEGNYLYIGSALGKENRGTPLARRLLRHASRSSSQAPHAIRAAMMTLFLEENFMDTGPIDAPEKKLRWHADYLLDRPEAEIRHIIIIRSPLRVEHKLAELLEALPETSLIAPRLGAQDSQNSTHLLRFTNRKQLVELLKNSIPGFLA